MTLTCRNKLCLSGRIERLRQDCHFKSKSPTERNYCSCTLGIPSKIQARFSCSLVRFKFTPGPRYFFKKDFSVIGGFCFFHLIFPRRTISLVKSDGSSAASGRFPSNKIVMRRISTNWWFRVKPAFINYHIKSIGLLSIMTLDGIAWSLLMKIMKIIDRKPTSCFRASRLINLARYIPVWYFRHCRQKISRKSMYASFENIFLA